MNGRAAYCTKRRNPMTADAASARQPEGGCRTAVTRKSAPDHARRNSARLGAGIPWSMKALPQALDRLTVRDEKRVWRESRFIRLDTGG